MREAIQEVLLWQTEYSSKATAAVSRRGDLVLTANEVALHIANHPNNALSIVRNIRLLRDEHAPTATDGELVLEMPWQVNLNGLQPIAYRYRTGL
jgi:hypothetical protein